jgi:hypothetical protein
MSAKIIGSHILLESGVEEDDEQFRDAIERIVLDIYGHRPDWLKFSPGKRFARGGVTFREFVCMAGSVALRITQRASRGELSRAVIYRADVDGVVRTYEIRAGHETEFCPDDLKALGTS